MVLDYEYGEFEMLNCEFFAYLSNGGILKNVSVNVRFNEIHSLKHKWSTVPFKSAKRLLIDTGEDKFYKELPLSGWDVPALGSPDTIREIFKEHSNFPTSANWFQIYHTLDDLAKTAGQRFVIGLEVIDNGETLSFIMEDD